MKRPNGKRALWDFRTFSTQFDQVDPNTLFSNQSNIDIGPKKPCIALRMCCNSKLLWGNSNAMTYEKKNPHPLQLQLKYR